MSWDCECGVGWVRSGERNRVQISNELGKAMKNLTLRKVHFITFIMLMMLMTLTTSGFAKSISEIVEANNEAVVLLVTFDKHQKPLGTGSGFFVKSDGVVVTNYHVIEKAYSIWVRLSNGGLFTVNDILNVDKAGDIAVLKVHGRKLPIVKMGDSRTAKVGDAVVAIGHPLAIAISLEMEIESSATEGIISARRTLKQSGRQILQISAPISPGSSGGTLLNMRGEVIGMTTATIAGGQNINFAVPINQIKNVIFGKAEPLDLAESAKIFYLKGVLAWDKRNFDAAEHFYKKTLEKDPNHVDAHLGMGMLYYERNLYDLQLKHFKEATRLDPNNLFAHWYLATAYEDKALFDHAIKEYKEVLRIAPKDTDALYGLGILYLVKGKREKAWRAYNTLQKLNPGLALKLKKLLDALKR